MPTSNNHTISHLRLWISFLAIVSCVLSCEISLSVSRPVAMMLLVLSITSISFFTTGRRLTNSTDLLATMRCEKEYETLRHCFIAFSSFRNRLYHPSRAQSLSLFKSVKYFAFGLFFGYGSRYGVSLFTSWVTSMHGSEQVCMCITMDQSITTYFLLIICARQNNFRVLNMAAWCGCWVWIVN